MHAGVPFAEPLPAKLEWRAVIQHQALGTPADALTGLDHGHLVPERHEPPGGGQSGQPGTDHDHVTHSLSLTPGCAGLLSCCGTCIRQSRSCRDCCACGAGKTLIFKHPVIQQRAAVPGTEVAMTPAGGHVVFIHGLWLHASSWAPWTELFQKAGYTPVAPGWPGTLDTVEETRSHPDQVAGKGIDDVVDHYAQIIRGLDAPPIVIGHSFGGLIAQRLLGQDLAAAGVAIDPAPIKGVLYLPASA